MKRMSDYKDKVVEQRNAQIVRLEKENAELRKEVEDLRLEVADVRFMLVDQRTVKERYQKENAELWKQNQMLRDFESRRIYASHERWKQLFMFEQQAKKLEKENEELRQLIKELEADITSLNNVVGLTENERDKAQQLINILEQALSKCL